MLIVATLLIAIGLVVSLIGAKLFRVLLPLIGLVSGSAVGFVGVQAIFGTGVVATTMAFVVALMVGILVAILSFAFFDLAVVIYIAMLGAAALSYVGVALGLSNEGFLVTLLAIAGAILAALWASNSAMSVRLVVALTSFAGVAYILTGFMLLAGNVSLESLNNDGIAKTILGVVDQSFLWFFVYVGASLIAMQVQHRAIVADLFTNAFQYDDNKRSVL